MNQCADVINPRCGVRVSAKGYHHNRFLECGQSGNQLVLSERQVVVFAVSVFTILQVILVQSADIQDDVCFACFLQGLFSQLCLHGNGDGVYLVVMCSTRLVSLRIINFIAIKRLQTFEWRDVVKSFELRRTAAFGERASGIFTHNKNFAVFLCVKR